MRRLLLPVIYQHHYQHALPHFRIGVVDEVEGGIASLIAFVILFQHYDHLLHQRYDREHCGRRLPLLLRAVQHRCRGRS